jgi:FlaA1/EpsC-like NDP-sugar epimerase
MDAYQEWYRDKTILITGGAGAIGTNLSRAISDLKARTVIVLDDMSAAYEWNLPSRPNILLVKGRSPTRCP